MAREHQGRLRLSRRRLAIVGGAVVVATATLVARRGRRASGIAVDIDDFMVLSGLVTARSDLDAAAGTRLCAALAAQDPDFTHQSRALLAHARAHRPLTGAELAAALDRRDPPLAHTFHRIVAAWYVGVVGNGPTRQAIADEHTLMYRAVRDALTPPSYCSGATGFWSAPPVAGPTPG